MVPLEIQCAPVTMAARHCPYPAFATQNPVTVGQKLLTELWAAAAMILRNNGT